MAETIVGSVTDPVVKELGTKVIEVIKNVIDSDSELKKLQSTRKLIEAALLDVDSTSEQYNHAQQDTLQKLSYQLDRLHDLLDVRASRKLQKQVMSGGHFTREMRSFFSPSNQLVARFKDARKVEDIKKKLNAIAINYDKFGRIIPGNPTQARSIQRVESLSNLLSNFVVGRDEDRDKIVSMLSEDSLDSGTLSLSVASIVGIGGMGKTTLAHYVYKDEKMKRCFDVQFWVSMTQDFDVTKVLVEMITACGGELPHNESNVDQLYHHFRRAIGGKKFLLVLDNIWDQIDLRDKWFNLRKLLELGANGSKVLITTRDQKVAGVMDSNAPYMLGDLTKDDSWLLFQKIAFTQWQEPGVVAIGKEISIMCPKMPLVIRSIGGLLAGKRTVQEWLAFRDDQLANFATYGRSIMQTLKFSYNQLEATQKLCVTYCSLFEKGGEFPTDEMIHRWIALGYVKPTYENQSFEEAGDECMISLYNCGFLQLYDFGCTFNMHDVMYELVLTRAGFKYKVTDSNTDEIDERVRHLSFWKAVTGSALEEQQWELPSSLFKISNLQSFIRGSGTLKCRTVGKSYTLKVRNLSFCGKLISKFKSLRVLDLDRVGIKGLPTSIGDLTCLRFLNMRETEIIKLPNSIAQLVNLQTLYLNDCDKLEELARDMSKLVNLRHVLLRGSKKLRHMPMGLGRLTSLRTLDTFIVGNHIDSKVSNMGKLADLDQLNNLSGSLDIEVHRESKYIASSEICSMNLKMKKNLQYLSVSFKKGTKEDERVLECLQPPSDLQRLNIEGYGGERLAGWMIDNLHNHLPNLIAINIKDCKPCKYLCSLGRLPHLKYLILSGLDEVEYVEDILDNNNESELSQTPLFPSLEHLVVSKMPKLKGWWRREQDSTENLNVQVQHQQIVNWKPAFPKLQELIVDNLELAITIAKQQIGGFTSLKYLQIWDNAIEQQALTLPLSSCFPNLRCLEYYDVRLEALPEGIRDLSSLETLIIDKIENIKAIPEWIDSLISLESLRMVSCPRLESLPHQIANLPNLKRLRIFSCPILWERCQRPDGEYYKYIQHIPHIYMYDPRETQN